jgi:H+/gluconate symporter-like permease
MGNSVCMLCIVSVVSILRNCTVNELNRFHEMNVKRTGKCSLGVGEGGAFKKVFSAYV